MHQVKFLLQKYSEKVELQVPHSIWLAFFSQEQKNSLDIVVAECFDGSYLVQKMSHVVSFSTAEPKKWNQAPVFYWDWNLELTKC